MQTDKRKEYFFEVFSDIADQIYIENLVNLWPEVGSNLGMEDMHRFFSDTPREMKFVRKFSKACRSILTGKSYLVALTLRLNDLGNLEREDLSEIWNARKCAI